MFYINCDHWCLLSCFLPVFTHKINQDRRQILTLIKILKTKRHILFSCLINNLLGCTIVHVTLQKMKSINFRIFWNTFYMERAGKFARSVAFLGSFALPCRGWSERVHVTISYYTCTWDTQKDHRCRRAIKPHLFSTWDMFKNL